MNKAKLVNGTPSCEKLGLRYDGGEFLHGLLDEPEISQRAIGPAAHLLGPAKSAKR
jgi:hypothetical protein